MASRIRTSIGEQISHYTKRKHFRHHLEIPAKQLPSTGGAFEPLLQLILQNEEDEDCLRKTLPDIHFNSDLINAVRIRPSAGKIPAKCEFLLQPQAFVEDVLQQPALVTGLQTQHIVIEFSSPNIAKPFHVGHLRSTIIGNVLNNLHRYLGYTVTSLNYLGDWGAQFGMLRVGVEILSLTDEQLRAEPIESLYRAYVAAHDASQTDPSIADRARQYFSELERSANADAIKQWEKYRQYTLDELASVYARLGITFDHYDWESQYSHANIGSVLQQLTEKSLLVQDETDGHKVVDIEGRRVSLTRSDGTTLYLARDIAALLDRLQRFQFDRIFYVVENGQRDHFNACFQTASALCENLQLEKLKHVKFGRIHGMSTRRGNAVLLRDVLDEARDKMLEKQLQTSTTKVELSASLADGRHVADILGISAVIVNDLKQRRQRDYNFDWNNALLMNGDTGIKLQYTHCRLSSLLANVNNVDMTDATPILEHLMEAEAIDLLLKIARFEQTLWNAKEQLEACILVKYLFDLCNSTSRALKRLNVKNESSLPKQQNRILLFQAAKSRLSDGMQILGLNPLTKM